MPNPLDPNLVNANTAPDGQQLDFFFHPEKYQTETKLITDSEDDLIAKKAKEMGLEINDSNRDYITQFVLNEVAQTNAWERQMNFEKNRYQYTMQDLQKAGLNPFLAIGGLNAGSASAGASSVQGGIYATNKKTEMSNGVKAGLGAAALLMSFIATVVKMSAMGG